MRKKIFETEITYSKEKMSIATPISQLKQLDEIQKSTYTQSLANKLRKSAAQTNLQELYKPLLVGQKEQLAAQKDSTSELKKLTKLSRTDKY
jgi:hypothetical protein